MQSLSEERRQAVYDAVRSFNIFSDDNDPYGERDYASFEVAGVQYFYKFDYYENADFEHGSPDPSDLNVTHRLLTIAASDDY